jgi:hypothetical protein
MDHAYVMNLDSRKDRWIQIQEDFKGSSIKLHRVSAVKRDPGAYGLLLTAIKVLEIAKRRGLPHVLILEDDCKPITGWQERWTKVKGWLAKHPTLWDVYSGGSKKNRDAKYIGQSEEIQFFQPYTSRDAHWIWIPARSYTKILDLYKSHMVVTQFHPTVAIDVLHNMLKRIISKPYIAYQRDGHSNLMNKTRRLQPLFRAAERALRITRKRIT